MSQAQCTAEVEAWLVRNNFTEPQRAHLLQQVDALSDFSEAVDEDIPAITAGWSSLARSKLRRCVAKLCAERGWECKLAAAAPAPAPAAPTAEITPAPSPPPQRPIPRGRPPKKQRKADTSGDAALARQLAAAESPRRAQPPKKKRPAAKPAPRPKKKAKPPAQPDDDATAGDAELARRLSLGLPVRSASGAVSMAVWDVPAAALPSRRRSSGADERHRRIEARVRSKILPYRGARIKFATPNPKQSLASEHGKKSKRRYDAYMGATTVGEFLSCGGRPADLCYDVERGYCEVTDARWAAAVAEEAKDDEAEEGAGAARLRDERWAARYDEVCWAREGDVWWPGVVMDPAAIAGAAAARARREQGQRYAVYNFGVDSAEQFSFAAPQNLVGWAEGLRAGHGAPRGGKYGRLLPQAVAEAEAELSRQEGAEEGAGPLPMPAGGWPGAPDDDAEVDAAAPAEAAAPTDGGDDAEVDEVDDFVISARAAPAPAPARAPRPPAVAAPRPPARARARPSSPRASSIVDGLVDRGVRVKRTGKPRTTQRAAAIERATTAREYVDRGGRKQDLLYDLKNDYFRVVREEDVPDGLAWLPPGVVFDREVRDAGGRWNSSKSSPYHATVVWCRWLPDFELRDAAGGVSRGAWQVQWKHRGSRTVSHVPKEDVRVRAAAPAPAAVPNHALLVGATAPTPAPAPVPPRPRAPPPAAAVVDLTQDDAAPPAPAPARARSPRAQTLGPCRPGVEGPKSIFTAPTGPRRAPAPAPAPAAALPPLPPFDPLATAPAPAAPAADDDDWRRRML